MAAQGFLLAFVIGVVALFLTWQLNGLTLLLFHGHSGLGWTAPFIFGGFVALGCHVVQVRQ
jgi:hypothetical protein